MFISYFKTENLLHVYIYYVSCVSIQAVKVELN